MKLIKRAIDIVLERPVIMREVIKEHLGWMIQNRYCPWHFGFETQKESLCNCGEDPSADTCGECWARAYSGREKEGRTDGDDYILVNTARKPTRIPKYKRPAAIVMGRCDRDNDITYMCPVCQEKFGGWDASMQLPNAYGSTKYCPVCKTELRF